MTSLQSKKQSLYTNGVNNGLMKIIIFLILLMVIPASIALTMRNGDIYLVRPNSDYIDEGYIPPEFLSVDDLIFYTCTDDEDISLKSSVICQDDNSFKDIEVIRWLDNENCYMGTYDLSERNCSRMIIPMPAR